MNSEALGSAAILDPQQKKKYAFLGSQKKVYFFISVQYTFLRIKYTFFKKVYFLGFRFFRREKSILNHWRKVYFFNIKKYTFSCLWKKVHFFVLDFLEGKKVYFFNGKKYTFYRLIKKYTFQVLKKCTFFRLISCWGGGVGHRLGVLKSVFGEEDKFLSILMNSKGTCWLLSLLLVGW